MLSMPAQSAQGRVPENVPVIVAGACVAGAVAGLTVAAGVGTGGLQAVRLMATSNALANKEDFMWMFC